MRTPFGAGSWLNLPIGSGQARVSGRDRPTWACGWMIRTDGPAPVHAHAGSAGTLFAHIELHPETQRAIVITMNVGLEGMSISQEISERINERWQSSP